MLITRPVAGAWKEFTKLSTPVQTLVAATIFVVGAGTFVPLVLQAVANFLKVLNPK